MPKVTVVQVVYNNRRFIETVFSSIYNQTFKDFQVVAVIAGNEDKGKELLGQKFPRVEILDPGYNIGFAKGHNLVFEKYDSGFFQLVNPDLVLRPDYLENILKAFEAPKVGAASGKLYQFKELRAKVEEYAKEVTLDTTGVVISKSGRARDRGQHETDRGQYDSSANVQAVSAAGAMYRAAALQAVRLPKIGRGPDEFEYFDEDFHSYWEDVDLSWRMQNAGWQSRFVPAAVGFHGRTAGSSKKGYKDIKGFVAHHRQLSPRIRQLNFKNHIFMYIKNARHFYPQFFCREFFMLIYILFFEASTFKVLPEFFKQLPRIWKKRKMIKAKWL